MEKAPREGIDYFTNRDDGDVTHSGAEIMYRLKQEEEQRQREMDDTFDDSPPINDYPSELNNRHG